MTAREPADRPTAANCAALFEKYLDNPASDSGELPTVVTKPVDPPTKSLKDPARTMRMRPVRAAGALAVLAAVVMGVVLLPSDAPPARPADQPPADPAMAPVLVVPETAAGQLVVPEPQPPAQRHPGGGEDNSGKKKPAKSGKGHG